MDELISPSENEVSRERLFNPEVDLCPLEHTLISSTLVLPGEGKIFNTETLRTDEDLVKDADLLLRPLGLTTKESNIEEIRAARQKRETLRAGYGCFSEVHKDYEFFYVLNGPDENGRIPNKFQFKFREMGSDAFWDKTNPQDVASFRKIQLSERFSTYGKENKPFFILTKDEDIGMVTLTFAPLQENINQ